MRLGQIVVRDVSETTLRTAFPDCEIAAVGAELQITFELRDLPETYPLLDRVRQTGATLDSLYIDISSTDADTLTPVVSIQTDVRVI